MELSSASEKQNRKASERGGNLWSQGKKSSSKCVKIVWKFLTVCENDRKVFPVFTDHCVNPISEAKILFTVINDTHGLTNRSGGGEMCGLWLKQLNLRTGVIAIDFSCLILFNHGKEESRKIPENSRSTFCSKNHRLFWRGRCNSI